MRLVVCILCLAISAFSIESKIVLGVAGGTGSGKTTLAKSIQAVFSDSSVLISQDSYYKDLSHLPFENREKVNFDHPDALDFEMLKNHIIALKAGKSIEQPVYNFRSHSREKELTSIESADVIIVEGILLFAVPEIRDLFDMKIYVEADDDIRFLRRLERDMSERGREFFQVKEQYLATVKPMHDAFVAPSKKYADIIFPAAFPNEKGFNMILAKIHEDLGDHLSSCNSCLKKQQLLGKR